MLRNILSGFFGVDLARTSHIQVRLREAEMRCHPFLYLVKFLLYCEQNSISPGFIRIFYIDSSCTFNENLILIRFPEFKSSIYWATFTFEDIFIPEIAENSETLAIFISDDIKLLSNKKLLNNCDIQVALITVNE